MESLKGFMKHLVSLNDAVLQVVEPKTQTEVRVDNSMDKECIILYDRYNTAARLTININETYVDNAEELECIVREILEDEYDPDNHPELDEFIIINEYDEDMPGQQLSSHSSGRGWGNELLSLTRAADLSASSYVLMDQVEKVFGAGTTDKSRKIRDRRFNKIFVLRNVPRALDELLARRKAPKEINLYIDTSGSIGFYESVMATAVVRRFKERYPSAKLNFYTFSTEVVDTEDFSWRNIRKIIGGGTELKPVIEHIREKDKRINVVIGDMYFNEICSDYYDNDEWKDIIGKTVFISTVNNSDTDGMFKRLGGDCRLCFKPA